MSADVLEQAFASSAKVLAGLQAGDLDKPTPCASWKVRDVVNHMVGGTQFFAETAETGVAPTTPSSTDFASGDISSAYAEGSARAVAAFRAEGAMEKTMKLPFGEFPGAIFVIRSSRRCGRSAPVRRSRVPFATLSAQGSVSS